ncbi:MAG: leucine-rich repeat domain-containing protein [Clostridia bacterium]|nr:leucine-rich repeat domain-containing protein [Clostridia bacterium]
MKKIFMCVLIVVCGLFVFSVAASAETTVDGLLTYTVSNGEATITGITDRAYEGALTLPDELGGCPVTSVSYSFFEGLRGYVTTLTLPSTLRQLDNLSQTCIVERFSISPENPYFTTDETGVLFDKDKTVLYRFPMMNPCTEYAVPDTVTEIKSVGFCNMNYLEYVKIPSGVETIPYMCFTFSHSLRTVELSEGVKYIGGNGIAECYGLEKLILPSTLERIDGTGISGCHSLKELVLPAGLKTLLGTYSIGDNQGLEKVVFLGAPQNVSVEAMKGNTALREVRFAGTEAEWNENAALSAMNLYGATLRCGYVHAENAETEFEGGVLAVGGAEALPAVTEGGFADWTDYAPECEALRLGESVRNVGSGAFAGFSELSEVVIDADGVAVAAGAFTGCEKLGTVVAFDDITFEDGALPEGAVVYAPAGAEIVYRGTAVRFSLADGVLTLEGEINADAYTFLDLVAVLCDRLGTVNKLAVSSLHLDGVEFYYKDENGRKRRVEDDTLVNGTVTAGVTAADGEDRELTFNELCAGVADGTLTGFYFSTATEEHGENIDTPVEISLAERIREGIQRVLKAIVTLLNRLFRFLKNLGK